MLRPIVIGILLGAVLFFFPFFFFFLLFFLCWRFFFRPWRRYYWHEADQTGTVPIDGRAVYEKYDRHAPSQIIPVH